MARQRDHGQENAQDNRAAENNSRSMPQEAEEVGEFKFAFAFSHVIFAENQYFLRAIQPV